ncbi:MAG: sensor histidine kinase [Spirochaetaceae bacterium]|nr:MAG: sensor histidine kinase [Spirochaetaceae bacterium]
MKHGSTARRIVGSLIAIASFGVAAVNASILSDRADSLWSVIASPFVWSLALGGALALASVFVARLGWVQPAYALAAGLYATWDGSPLNLTGFIIVFLALLYAWELGYLDRYGRLTVSAVLTAFIVAIVGGGLVNLPGASRQLINAVIAASALASVGWYVIVRRIRESEQREIVLEEKVADRTADLETALIAERQALDANRVLLAELHHRTKNNLQLVSSMLSFERDSLADPVDASWVEGAQNRIWSLSRLHDLLFASTPSEETDLAYFLREYLREVTDLVGHRPAEVSTDVSVDGPVPVDLAIRVALILHEIALGAIDSALRSDSTPRLRIGVSAYDGRVRITTSDAVPDEPAGTAREELGRQIVVSLAESVGGTAIVDRSGGTAWMIDLPLPATPSGDSA